MPFARVPSALKCSANWQRSCYPRTDFTNKHHATTPLPPPPHPQKKGHPWSADRPVLRPTRPHLCETKLPENGRDIFRRRPSYGEHFLFLQMRKERSDLVKPLLLATGLNSLGSERADCPAAERRRLPAGRRRQRGWRVVGGATWSVLWPGKRQESLFQTEAEVKGPFGWLVDELCGTMSC